MFAGALDGHYPGALPAARFLDRSVEVCAGLGIVPGNALAMEALCRDELVFAVEAGITDRWGPAFDLGSLAGMVFLGRTGLAAASHHAPSADGRHRFVVYAMPHIAIDGDGQVGVVHRPGQDEPSTACGALLAFAAELAAGRIVADLDPGDLEQSLLRQRLLRRLTYGAAVPTLPELTELTRQAMVEDLTAAARALGAQPRTDVAVFTGTLVHGPHGSDWIAPAACFAVLGGGAAVPLTLDGSGAAARP